MTTDRILAIIGIVIGVPAFLSLFIDSQLRVQGVLVLIIIGLVIAYRIYRAYRDKLPALTILELRKNYVIQDSLGVSTKFERTQRMRANQKNVNEFWFRNMTQDGTVSNFLIDGDEPELQKLMGGTINIGKRFHVPLEVGQEITIVMTCDYRSSFTDPHREGIVHLSSLPTKLLIISVTLAKPCLTAKAYKTYGGQAASPISEVPGIGNGNRQLELKIKKPAIGASYHLDWTW